METTALHNFSFRSIGVAAKRAGKDSISGVTPLLRIPHFSYKGRTLDIVILFSCTLNLQFVIPPTSLTLQKETMLSLHFPQSHLGFPRQKSTAHFKISMKQKVLHLFNAICLQTEYSKNPDFFSFTLLIWLSEPLTVSSLSPVS